jgi:ubiquinone/menaquinone biosynthesis C-methylase UbiE
MNTTPSEDDIKKHITGIFNTVASGYDNTSTRFFNLSAEKMLDILHPKQNARLLDIATGTGAVAVSAAQILKPEGRVHGIDLSEKMLDKAFVNIHRLAINNIELHIMDAENPTFEPDYFHYITCSFGLFFLPDMTLALKNWSRILQPGGEIIFSSFGPSTFLPMAQLFKERLARYDVIVPEAMWFRLSDKTACEQILSDAGFTDISICTHQLGYHVSNFDDWWEICWNTGFRGFLNQLSADNLSQFRKEHMEEIAQLKTNDGIWLDVETIFSSAKKAS